MEDLYDLLDISRSASQSEIKLAYRKKAKIYHPDLNPDDEESQEHFKKINLAYEVLSDKERRSQYDRFGNAIFENAGSSSGFSGGFDDFFSSIFDDIFGDTFSNTYSNKTSRNTPEMGGTIEHQVNLTFDEAVFGVEKEISIRRKEVCQVCKGSKTKEGSEVKTCPTCQGTGKVQNTSNTTFGSFIRMETCPSCHGSGEYIEDPCPNCNGQGFEYKNRTLNIDIPHGVDNGTILKLPGEGHAGKNGGPAGYLYIRISVKDHEFFKRDGYDVYYELPIRFSQAVLGDEIDLPSLEGIEKFDLPAGTQSEQVFTLENKGIKRPGSDKRGHIHFKVKIVVPKNLSKQQKDLLREFDEKDGESTKEQKGFFERIKGFFE